MGARVLINGTWYYISAEARIPKNHPLKKIRELVRDALSELSGSLSRLYATKACQNCAIQNACTTGKAQRISRWEHEHVLETVQRRLDEHPEKVRQWHIFL
jgi:hypothetical protein